MAAFERLLGAIPEGSGLAFILVQHPAPGQPGVRAESLARHPGLRLVEARSGVAVESDHVYIIPPAASFGIRAGRLDVAPPLDSHDGQGPIDHLFRCLAEEYGSRAIALLLAGAGCDGAAGLQAVRTAGGLTFVHHPEPAPQAGMREETVLADVADLVPAIEDIPEVLLRHAERIGPDHPGSDDGHAPREEESIGEEDLRALGELVQGKSRLDIRRYRPEMVNRRLRRRMALMGIDSFAAYLQLLRERSDEVDQVVRDLLISVTEFFRDPDAFEALAKNALDPLVRSAEPGEPLRVWIAGCATGEETYSIAMLLWERMEQQGRDPGLQVFATDVDAEALEVARAGVYPASIAERISPQRLERFFTPVDVHGFRIRPLLRDVVCFAVHDICADPPLSGMHLVSCRNVLIYLRPEAQQRVYRLLHFALRPGGVLYLGRSESLGAGQELFTPISKQARLYRRIEIAPPGSIPMGYGPIRGRHPGSMESRAPVRSSRSAEPSLQEQVRSELLHAWVPPSVVVGEDGRVLYVHGKVGPWMEIPQGEPSPDLSTMLKEHLRTRVRSALHKCRRDRVMVVAYAATEPGSADAQTRITVRPAMSGGLESALIVTFEPVALAAPAPAELSGARPVEHEVLVEHLERELQAMREDLRNTADALEAANEELRTSREETLSMNEELQSSNEELEATTEELRSLNEELTTVNVQIRDRLEELREAHDMLSNFFASTKLATVFLDDALRFKHVTPAAGKLLRLGEQDIGRSVADLARELLQRDLLAEARSVLEELRPVSREIEIDGRWFVRRVLPYRTSAQRIEGVVVTFTDVTELKHATARLTLRERQQAAVAHLGLRALASQDLQAFMDHVVREVQQTLDTDYCKVLELLPDGSRLLLKAGMGWQEGLVGVDQVPAGGDSQAGYTLLNEEPVVVEDLGQERRFSGPQLLLDHGVTSGMSCVIRDGDGVYGVLGVHTRDHRAFSQDDVNFLVAVANVLGTALGRQRAEELRVRLAAIVEASEDAIFSKDMNGIIQTWNWGAARLYGYTADEIVGKPIATLIPAEIPNELPGIMARLMRGEPIESYETVRQRKDGSRVDVSVSISPLFDQGGRLIGAAALARDITRLKEAERALRESERQYRKMVADAPVGILLHAGAGETLVVNRRWTEITGYSIEDMPTFDHWLRLAYREGAGEMRRIVADMERSGETSRGEYPVWTKRGAQRVLLIASACIGQLPDGRGLRSTVAWDITEQRRAERRLATEHAVVKALAESASLDEAVPSILEGLCAAFGVDVAELWRPDEAGEWMRCVAQHTRHGSARLRTFEETTRNTLVRRGGGLPGRVWSELRPVVSACPPEDPGFMRRQAAAAATLRTGLAFPILIEGQCAGVICLLTQEVLAPDQALLETMAALGRNIGQFIQRIDAQKRLRESQTRLQRTVASAQVGIAFARFDGRVIDCNDTLLEMMGYSREELRQRAIELQSSCPPEDLALWARMSEELAREGRLGPIERLLLRRDGTRIPVLESASLLDIEDEYVTFIVDLQAQKRAEQALRDADRHKDEYLAMLGHELRNPLAALMTAVQLQNMTATSDERDQRARAIIERQVRHMTKLVDGLLDVSRIARGKIDLDQQAMDLKVIVREVAATWRTMGEQAGIALTVELTHRPVWVYGDATRLTQVVDNLLNNAFKFTRASGSVGVALDVSGEEAVLRIRDTGIGIEPELQKVLFEPFRQASQSLDRAYGGLGIGLALAKGLVDLHGGRIAASSEGQGKGAEFVVRLPLVAPPGHERVAALVGGAGPLRILVVEDNRDTADMLGAVLELAGYEVQIAYSGHEAVALARRQVPAVVLCDIGLPDAMSGYDVARALREDEVLRGCYLVALTGYGRQEDRERAQAAGFDEHLTKPVDLAAIEAVLARLKQ